MKWLELYRVTIEKDNYSAITYCQMLPPSILYNTNFDYLLIKRRKETQFGMANPLFHSTQRKI